MVISCIYVDKCATRLTILKRGEYLMKYISGKDINIGIILVVLVVVTFVIGVTKWPFFILSATFLFSYIRIDKKRLRCPNCGGFENLERLLFAKKRNYHCRHCGEKINIR